MYPYDVAAAQGDALLPVHGQERVGRGGVGFEADAGVRGQDDGREALEEGRNGRKGEGLHLGMHQRPVGGQGIRRGAEGRGDDHPVGAHDAHVFAVHEHMDGQHAGDGAAPDHHVVGGVPAGDGRPATQELPREQEAGARDHLSGEEAFQRGFPADGGEFGQKADLTEIDAEKRNVQPGKLAAHADEGSVAAEDQDCVGGAGPADEFFGRAVGGKGGTSHTVGFEPLADGCCGGFGGGVPGLGDEKYGGDGVHLLSVVESL